MSVMGCTIGNAICCKARHAGIVVVVIVAGVHEYGALAQTHSVRELIASCVTKLLCLTPPLIGTKWTRGSSGGTKETLGDARSLVERRGVWGGEASIVVDPMDGMNRRGKVGAMVGTLLGILFLVHRECVRFVVINPRFAVGFGAAMIGGASVMCCRGGGVVTL